jgi:sec-independent protein translocase protein TatA
MGFGGIGVGSLLLILLIVVVLFGTKKLRNIGADLGGGLKSFKKAMQDGDDGASGKDKIEQNEKREQGDVIEGEVTSKEKDKV